MNMLKARLYDFEIKKEEQNQNSESQKLILDGTSDKILCLTTL